MRIAKLHVYSNYAGTASVVVDPEGAIDFPSECVFEPPSYEAEISGIINQAGIHTVTITMNGVSDSVEVEVQALPNNIYIGPDTTVNYDGSPVTFSLVVTCDKPDTTVNLFSTGIGITLPDPPIAIIANAPIEVPIIINGHGEYSVTAESGNYSATALIHSLDEPVRLHLEADKDIYTKDLPATFDMRVFCSADDEVTLYSFGSGITIPDSVTVVNGVAEFEVTVSEEGSKIISAVLGVAYSECSLNISEEAFIISLGEDRHIYYQGDDITFTKTAYCNKDGIVLLSYKGDGIDIPSSVAIIDGTAKFDVTIHGSGTTIISAVHEDKPLVDSECKIIVSDIPIVLTLGADRTFNNVVGNVDFDMNVFCNRDGTCKLSSDYATVADAVLIINGFGTFNVSCARNSIISAQFGEADDSCNIILNPPEANVYIGPDITLTEPNATIRLAVIASKEGVATIHTLPPFGLEFPSTVEFKADSLEQEIEGSLTELGDYTVSISMDGVHDSCSVAATTRRHCMVHGTILDIMGKPVRMAAVRFSVIATGQTVYSSVLSTNSKIAYTDQDGYFSIRLLRGSSLIVSCEQIQYRKNIIVPDQASADIKDTECFI